MMKVRLIRLTIIIGLISLGLCCCGTPQQKEARYLKEGDRLYKQGDLEKARVEYRNAMRIAPADASVVYRIGLIDDSEGKFHDAYVNFSNAEQLDSHFNPAKLKLAEYYLAAGQYDDAKERIDVALSEAPNDAQGLAILAAYLLQRKQYNNAENTAHHSLAYDPNNTLAYAILIGTYRAQNDMPHAMAAAQDGLVKTPDDKTLLQLQAELYEQQGALDKAVTTYNALFKVAPTEAKYRLQLVDDLLKERQIDQAEAVLRDGVSALPQDWQLKRQLVLFIAKYRDAEQTEKEIRTIMVANPDRTEPIDWLVNMYITGNKEDSATAFLRQIISQNKYDAVWFDAMASLARIDYVKGDLEGTHQLADEALAKDANNLEAQFINARLTANQGDLDQAVIALRGIIRDQPQAKEAYLLLSDILVQQGHTDLAIETLNQFNDLAPLDVESQVHTAQLYALNGEMRRAKELLLTAAKTDPNYAPEWVLAANLSLGEKDWATVDAATEKLTTLPGQNSEALLLHGERLALTNKMAEAITIFSGIISADPSTPIAEQALQVLYQAYRSTQQYEAGARYLASLKPQTPLVSTLLGQCYEQLGDDEKASAAFNKAIVGHARMQAPYLGQAAIFLRQHKENAALEVLDQGAASDPHDMRAPLSRAQLLETLGHSDLALKIYINLYNKNPDNDLVANNYAELIADHFYKDVALVDRAHQITERFAASSNPLLLDTVGWVYYRQNLIAEAMTIFVRASGLAKDLPPQFHYHYGAILMAADRRSEAHEELRQATAGNYNYPGSEEAKQLYTSLTAH
jgi:predicted Zn-dependent protease